MPAIINSISNHSIQIPSFGEMKKCFSSVAIRIATVALLPLGALNALAQYGEIDLFAWQHYFFEPVTPYSKEFLKELERTNRKK